MPGGLAAHAVCAQRTDAGLRQRIHLARARDILAIPRQQGEDGAGLLCNPLQACRRRVFFPGIQGMTSHVGFGLKRQRRLSILRRRFWRNSGGDFR